MWQRGLRFGVATAAAPAGRRAIGAIDRDSMIVDTRNPEAPQIGQLSGLFSYVGKLVIEWSGANLMPASQLAGCRTRVEGGKIDTKPRTDSIIRMLHAGGRINF